MVHSIKTK